MKIIMVCTANTCRSPMAEVLMRNALLTRKMSGYEVTSAGVFAMVLECMPAELGKRITEAVSVPTIGIGAGVHCSGQVQVVNDLLGLFTDFQPKHARRYANLTEEIRRAFTEYVSDVREQKFPGPENSF